MAGNLDQYRIESHKLVYHVDKVSQWLEGENIYPIYIEVGPVARCQQRCIYCAFDYLEYKGPILDAAVLKRALIDAGSCGVRSVMFAGEGEPLLHTDIGGLVATAKGSGLDVALTTNGLLFGGDVAVACLPFLSWVRFSLDAANKETYTKIHRSQDPDFHRVTENIQRAVLFKKKLGFSCTIGVQALLLPENSDEMLELANLCKGFGVDYLIIKPFSKHPLSLCNFDIDYSRLLGLAQHIKEFETDNFKVIFRINTMRKLNQERPYKECLGLPFFTYVAATGDVYACSAFLGNQEFVYGNIYLSSFSEIWKGEQRQTVLRKVAEMGVESCREVCRLDEINRYLWELRHPEEVTHFNFI